MRLLRPMLFGLMFAVGLAPQIPGLAQAPAAPKVQLTFEPGGLVSLVATDATLREVLAEWTRKGGTPFVGAERLSGSAQSLQYDHRPETEVVTSLLRGASGVVMAPRDAASNAASTLGVVFVLATSNPTMGGYSAPTYVPQQPMVSTQGSPDTEIAPVGPGRSGEPPAPAPAPRPAGVSGVAVPVVPIVPVTTTPITTGAGRGGRGGGGR